MRAPMRNASIAARLIAWSKDDDHGCRIWTGAVTTNGYGRVRLNGRSLQAHRVAYETFVGPIPSGLTLDHLCRARLCILPTHLEPVTLAENIRRGGNGAKTHCIHGHEFTPENTRVRPDGTRDCRVCNTERHRARYQARSAS